MNKVITINLHGSAFQLEEAAYDSLRAYLDNAARQLANNPDKDEIIADIEQAIGDKCRAVLDAHKNVVLAAEIQSIIASMGPVVDGSSATTEATPSDRSDPSAASDAASTSSAPQPPPPVRRLYRLYPQGAMLSGVCNGLGAYLGLDPTLIRVIFVLLACLTFGGMALAYIVLVIMLPLARTAEEKAAAQGAPSTAQEFIRRAREGYYQAAKTWGDKQAHREWKRKFRHEMRAWKNQFRYNMHQQSAAWRQAWRQTPPPAPDAPAPDGPLWIAAPFAGLLKAALTLLAIFAVISLLLKGTIFTFTLPADVPVWVAIVCIFIVYQILAAPFHALRRAYRHGYYYPPHPLAILLSVVGSIFGCVMLVFAIWYLNRHVPEAHEFFQKIPPALHSLLQALRDWWASL